MNKTSYTFAVILTASVILLSVYYLKDCPKQSCGQKIFHMKHSGRNADGSWMGQLERERGIAMAPVAESSPQTSGYHKPATIPADTESELDLLSRNVKTCLDTISLSRLLNRSTDNAQTLLTQYRKVIPRNFLHSLGHCWDGKYKIRVLRTRSRRQNHLSRIIGNTGDVKFDRTYTKDFETRRLSSVSRGPFSSQTLCLPTVFIAGFMKCGSTFLDCFVSKIVQASLSTNTSLHASKEPRFWVEPFLSNKESVKMPSASDLGGYIANFAPGIEKVQKDRQTLNMSKFIMMDGSPFYLNGWPRYHTEDDVMTNTCILPSTMPLLLPKSKYIVIMREPVNALYSSFWFSCQMYNRGLSRKNQLKGPDVFHERVVNHLDTFNECMTDKRLPELNSPCCLEASCDYSTCIVQRFHLLHRCLHTYVTNLNSSTTPMKDAMPRCGHIRLDLALYYPHVQKWLSVVPQEKFLFLALEDMKHNLKDVTTEILQFLDLPLDEHILQNPNILANKCTQNKQQNFFKYKEDHQLNMRNDTKELLSKFFHPFNTKLRDFIYDLVDLWQK